MEEPSVLDYLKSLLHLRGSPKIVFPPETPVEGEEGNGIAPPGSDSALLAVDESLRESDVVQNPMLDQLQVGETDEWISREPGKPSPWPWRAVIALFLALFAQLEFETA